MKAVNVQLKNGVVAMLVPVAVGSDITGSRQTSEPKSKRAKIDTKTFYSVYLMWQLANKPGGRLNAFACMKAGIGFLPATIGPSNQVRKKSTNPVNSKNRK